jgi:hypothetical protein
MEKKAITKPVFFSTIPEPNFAAATVWLYAFTQGVLWVGCTIQIHPETIKETMSKTRIISGLHFSRKKK